jgi:hypothetical protein
MLKERNRTWVIQDFIKEKDKLFGISQGRIAKVLNEMGRIGYIEREKRGVKSNALFTNREKLIDDWTKEYKFEYNEIHSFYSPDKNILKKIKEYFDAKKLTYALTLHTAANLYTSFVKTEDVYFYLQGNDLKKDILNLRQGLELKQLVQGGNVHILKPYYKTSVFFNIQKIKGYNAVSNLQLYLDLYNFQPRGREHAEYLKKLLEEKGRYLD